MAPVQAVLPRVRLGGEGCPAVRSAGDFITDETDLSPTSPEIAMIHACFSPEEAEEPAALAEAGKKRKSSKTVSWSEQLAQDEQGTIEAVARQDVQKWSPDLDLGAIIKAPLPEEDEEDADTFGFGAPLTGATVSCASVSSMQSILSAGEGEGIHGSHAARFRFRVVLDFERVSDKVGMKVIRRQRYMLVKSVTEGGLMALWNANNPRSLVKAGDRVVDCNGLKEIRRASGKWITSQDIEKAMRSSAVGTCLAIQVERKLEDVEIDVDDADAISV